MRFLTRFFLRGYAWASGVQQCWPPTRIWLQGFERRNPRFTSHEPRVTFL